MMPSARVSCRKAKLPITLMAVRALPRFKLRFKSIKDQSPSHKRDQELSRIRFKTRLDLGSFSFFLDGRPGNGRSLYQWNLGGLSRKLGFGTPTKAYVNFPKRDVLGHP